MKKILISLSIIAAVAAIAIGATTAYFSDTEQSTGNTFTAGTIDIAVDNMNPWQRTEPFHLTDMKPSQVDYTNFTVKNVGTNPVNVWKKVSGVVAEENGINEPECAFYQGAWTPGTPGNCSGGTPKNDIDTVIQYDLSVVVKNEQGVAQWNQTLYNMNKTIAQINLLGGDGTYLGMIPEGWSMDVTESYHMLADTGNWAQSDKMTFNITLTAVQLTGTAILENKDQVAPWRVLGEDGKQGTLTYGVKDDKFNFSFTGTAPLASTPYSLIVYKEPFSTPADSAWPRSVIILGSATSDGSGVVPTISGSTELSTDLLNSKIWLVKSSDLTGSTMSAWNGADYLLDTGLIDYYDTNN